MRTMTLIVQNIFDKNDTSFVKNKNKCGCGKISRYSLCNENNVNCQSCNNVMYNTNDIIYKCSSRCRYDKWIVKEYCSDKNDTTFKASYIKNKNKCINCNICNDIQTILISNSI